MEGVLVGEGFGPIEFHHRCLKQTGSVYHVYRDATDYAEVEATSAVEAMERSEITKPYKVRRYLVNALDVLGNGMLLAQKSGGTEEAAAANS